VRGVTTSPRQIGDVEAAIGVDPVPGVQLGGQLRMVGEQRAEFLPERETLDLISANVAAPVNAAVALNVLTSNSVAYAQATQNVTILQDMGG
jgi:hypothetical protein